MKLYVCSVYDKSVAAFNTPMFFRAIGEAKRSFLDACTPNKGQKMFLDHPQDYVLMHLGMFDDQDGSLSSEATGASPIMTALEALSIQSAKDPNQGFFTLDRSNG